MFDSPFDYCVRSGEVVLLDQTLTECAREHGCPDKVTCPLQTLFCGRDFSSARKVVSRAKAKRKHDDGKQQG